MSDNEIGPIIRLPDEIITLIPGGELEFRYQRSPGGLDLISIMLGDPRVGPVRLTLTVPAVQHAVVTLAAMLDKLDTLRQQWEEGLHDD